jgi:hypothetical protein
MANARTKPPSNRPDAWRMPRTGSTRPPRGITRLEEALADAERMAKRVDRVLEEDPFAAAILAREYLSLVQELDVNPLNQRGRTDAWTSAFVRLRVASNMLERHAQRADGVDYLVARAEERRLLRLFGRAAPQARLAAVRAEARAKQSQKRAFRVAAWLSMIGGLAAVVVACVIDRPFVAIFGALAGALFGATGFGLAGVSARAFATATQSALELEHGIAGLATFDASERGPALIQRIQREHPLLVRTSHDATSSSPPSPNGPSARK